jgi:hypothetical protein
MTRPPSNAASPPRPSRGLPVSAEPRIRDFLAEAPHLTPDDRERIVANLYGRPLPKGVAPLLYPVEECRLGFEVPAPASPSSEEQAFVRWQHSWVVSFGKLVASLSEATD